MESSKRKSNVNEHRNIIHKEKKAHECPICGYSFTTNSSLKAHVDAIHDGKKPHKCSICDCNFSKKDKLKRHVNSILQDKIHTTTKGN